MKQVVIDKINSTNQKYLKPLLGKTLPQKLVNQLRKKQLGVLYTYLATCVHSSYRLKVIKGSGSSRK